MKKIYAFRIHSTMTDDSQWFLSEDKENIKKYIHDICDMFRECLNKSSESSEAGNQYFEDTIKSFCKEHQIICEDDIEFDPISFDDIEGEYYYKDIPIEIVDEWAFRF